MKKHQGLPLGKRYPLAKRKLTADDEARLGELYKQRDAAGVRVGTKEYNVLQKEIDKILGEVTTTANVAYYPVPIGMVKPKRNLKEDQNPISDYTVTVKMPVEEAAKIFKIDLDFGGAEDYGAFNLRKSDLVDLPFDKKHEDAPLYFDDSIRGALSLSLQLSAQSQMYKEAMDVIEKAFEMIDPGTVEYIGETEKGEQFSVSAQAGVKSCKIDKGEVEIEILNPHHLVNGIVSGVGLMGPDIPVDARLSASEAKSYIHNLVDYFEVYGERMPQADGRGIEPYVDDAESFNEFLSDTLADASISEVLPELEALLEEEGEDFDLEKHAKNIEKMTQGGIKAKEVVTEFLKLQEI